MLTTKKRGLPGAWILWALALAGFFLFGGCSPAGPKALIRGQSLLNQERVPEALEKLRLAVELMPNNAQAWNYLGVANHLAGNAAEAVRAYNKAISLNEGLWIARFNLGCHYLEHGLPGQAVDALNAYCTSVTNDPLAWKKLGEAQYHSRKYGDAAKSFARSLALDPSQPSVLTRLGLIEIKFNRPRTAHHRFYQAYKLDPQYAPALLNIAVLTQNFYQDLPGALKQYGLYLNLEIRPIPYAEQVERLMEQIKIALNSTASNAGKTNANASVQASTENLANAASPSLTNTVAHTTNAAATNAANQAAASSPKDEAPLDAADANQSESEDQETADLTASNTSAKESRGALKDGLPSEATTESSSVEIDLAEDEPKEDPPRELASARETSKPALRDDASEALPPPNAGREETDLPIVNIQDDENPASAQESFLSPADVDAPKEPAEASVTPLPSQRRYSRYSYRTLIRPDSGDRAAAKDLFIKAYEAQTHRRWSEAIAFYKEAVEKDPSYFPIQYNLGYCASVAGDMDLALASYEKALAIEPDSVDTRYFFAKTLRDARHPRDAARELMLIVEDHPNDARAHFALANIYSNELRLYRSAKEHYEKLLELEPSHPKAPQIRKWIASFP